MHSKHKSITFKDRESNTIYNVSIKIISCVFKFLILVLFKSNLQTITLPKAISIFSDLLKICTKYTKENLYILLTFYRSYININNCAPLTARIRYTSLYLSRFSYNLFDSSKLLAIVKLFYLVSFRFSIKA